MARKRTVEMREETLLKEGMREPGMDRFLRIRSKGASETSRKLYAKNIATVRRITRTIPEIGDKPLMKFSVDDAERLAEVLAEKPKSYATAAGMFWRVHKMRDHAEALHGIPDNARRLGLDEILTPEDVGGLIRAARNLRDRALISTLASTGARIAETLNLRRKDIRPANGDGAYQAWFPKTKVKGQERFSPRIEGLYAKHLEAWLRAHPKGNDPEAYVFNSLNDINGPLDPAGVGKSLKRLADKVGIKKPVNPHAFRHARVTWGVINGEDMVRLSIGIWGKARSMMLDRYTHYNNADIKLGEMDAPVSLNLDPLPSLPQFEATEKIVERVRQEVRREVGLEMQKQMREIVEQLGGVFTDKAEDVEALKRAVAEKTFVLASVPVKKKSR